MAETRLLVAANAIAQRDGDGLFSGVLSDDVFIEFGDNLTRCQFVETERFFEVFFFSVNNHN